MPDAEGVVLALPARRERGEPAVLLDRVQPVAPAGEHLVWVRLVTDIPYQQVPRGLVHVVQRNGELDRSEARREVTTAGADGLDEELAQLTGERGQPVQRQMAQVRRRRDPIEQRVLIWRIVHRC